MQAWLNRYVEAWETYDPKLISDLFTEDATYRYHPWDDGEGVVRGRDAIVAAWVEPDGAASGRDDPGTYDAAYEPFAIDGDRAVATGWSRYWKDADRREVDKVFDNCYLLRFGPDGRCSEFTEFFIQRPATVAAASR